MPYIGEIAALTAAFLWGSTVLIFEVTGRQVGSFVTNHLRIVFGLVLLCITLYIQQGVFFPVYAGWNQSFWLGLSGIIGLAIGDGALFWALIILGSRRASLLLSLAPPFTTIIGWFVLSETLEILALLGIALTVAGIIWVVNEQNVDERTHGSKLKGVILGIIAALGQATGVILVKYGLEADLDALSATILRMAPAAGVMTLVAITSRQLPRIRTALKSPSILLAIVIGSFTGPYFGVWLSIVAVKYTAAGIASTLLATVPVMVIPMVVIVHKVRPSFRAIVGTLVTVIGVALIFLR